jgi:hypothetical protein
MVCKIIFIAALVVSTHSSQAQSEVYTSLANPVFKSEIVVLSEAQLFDFVITQGKIFVEEVESHSESSDFNYSFRYPVSRHNQEYCRRKGLEGSGKWICSPAGAGQKAKCFQCK